MAEPSFPYNPMKLPGNAFTLWLPPKSASTGTPPAAGSARAGKLLILPGQAFTVWTRSVSRRPARAAASRGSNGPLQLPGRSFTLWTAPPKGLPGAQAKSPSPAPARPVSDPGILQWAALLVALAVLAFTWTKNRELTAQNANLRRAAESDRQIMEGQLGTSAKALTDTRQQMTTLQASLTEMENAKVALATEKQSLEQKVKTLNDQAVAAKQDAEKRAATLQQTVDTLTKDKTALQGTADARKADVEKTQAALTEAQKSLKQAQDKGVAAEKQVADAKGANDQLKKESEQTKADAEKMKANVEAATRDKEELRKSVEALVTTIKELEKALADAKKAATGQ